jgi:hypothetical protein
MDNIKIEIWKDIIGYEGYYQISNLGNVKSLNRIVKNKNGYRNTGERLLKIYLPKDSQHYPFVILCKNGKTENKLIHRLVATAFVTNDDPIHKTQVNHIDENKMNNSSDNLEWCTPKYNAEYGTRIERTKKSTTNNQSWKRVLCEETGKTYRSIRSASMDTGDCEHTIARMCNGLNTKNLKYHWRYV